MNRIIASLALVKVICVVRDPEHDLFRPISMYQTAEYAFLGTLFVALLAVASALVLRKMFRSAHAEGLVVEIVALFGLTLLMMLLVAADLRYGGFHTAIAVSAMLGFAAFLFYVGHTFNELPLKLLGAVILAGCLIPAVHPPAFGVIENLALVLFVAAFWYLYYVTIEQSSPAVRHWPQV